MRSLIWRISTALSLLLVSALSGCGGGSSAAPSEVAVAVTPPTAQLIDVKLYITDDFSAEHEAVWVSISKITAVNASGETVLVTYDPALSVNLPTLKRAGAWLGNAKIPSDATAVRVYIGSTAKLQTLAGTVKDVTVVTEGGYISIRLDGWSSQSGVLAVDFDLPKFILQGNTLTVATRIATSGDQNEWTQRLAEIKGTITAISDSSVTLNSTRYGAFTAIIDTNTTFRSKSTAGWKPVVGSIVEIYALQTSSSSWLARSIDDESLSSLVDNVKIKGKLFSVSGTTVTLNIIKSESAALVGTQTIDVSVARFERGSIGILQVGQEIEAYVQRKSDGTWSAVVVEIEGAAKATASGSSNNSGGSNDSGNDDSSSTYGELKGTVASVSGNKVTLNVLYSKLLSGVTAGTQYTVDLTGAYFERGSLACLVSGTPVEMKGYFATSGVLKIVKVELESACNSSSNSSNPVTGALFVEAEGSISAISSGQFTLTLYKLEGYPGSRPTSITVTHDTTTYFKRVTSDALRAGMFVEVKGYLTGTTLKASKIELED
jgi:hypothetical protein